MDTYKSKYEKYKNKYLSLKSDFNSAKEKRDIIKQLFKNQTGGAAQALLEDLTCPITQTIMIDPVMASDGRTYERSAIVQWMTTHNTSPMTRERLTNILLPNWSMKNIIESLITRRLLNDQTIQGYTEAIAASQVANPIRTDDDIRIPVDMAAQQPAPQVANPIRTDDDIRIAVNMWINDRVGAEAQYGHIRDWDTSAVTYMASLFIDRVNFNEDLRLWNVSSVTNMWRMFKGATSFTSDLSSWNTGSVTNMTGMFVYATSFTSDLSQWNVSRVTNMRHMFLSATSFTSDLSGWDVSSVTDMRAMFHGARSFTSDLSAWNTSSVTNMGEMFDDTPAMLVKPVWYRT